LIKSLKSVKNKIGLLVGGLADLLQSWLDEFTLDIVKLDGHFIELIKKI